MYVNRSRVCSYLHCTSWVEFVVCPGLHDFVEGLVGHDARDEQLRRADVVERQRLDLGDVHAHLAVDARALDAHDHAEVRRQPRGVWQNNNNVACC